MLRAVPPAGYTARLAVANLREKLDDEAFCRDLDPLVAQWTQGNNVAAAGQLAMDAILSQVS